MQAVKSHKGGVPASVIAESIGMSPKTIYRWLRDYLDGGQSALLAKPIPGRPPKLTTEQMTWVARTVRDETPLQHKFPFGLWTLRLIRELIERRYGVKLAVSTTHRLMHLMGFSSQKPLRVAWQQDAALVRTWERETFPAIRAEAKRTGASIYFADEAGMRSDHQTGSTWAPVGQSPVVEATGRRYSLNMLSAISTIGEVKFMIHDGRVTADVFVQFLERLLIGAEGPIFLIVDGHPVHHSKRVRTFVESTDGKLKLFYLPPYSPHLNPAESVWANVKSRVAKRFAETKEQLREFIDEALMRLAVLPGLAAALFKQPEYRYITQSL